MEITINVNNFWLVAAFTAYEIALRLSNAIERQQ